MQIWLVRHAEAAAANARTSDFERPLTEPGRAAFNQMLTVMDWSGSAPDLIVHSPRHRAVQTAELLSEQTRGELTCCQWLSASFFPEQLVGWLNRQVAEAVGVVGHEPSMSRAAEFLTGCYRIRFAPGTIACIGFHGLPSGGQGQLHWIVTPGIFNGPQ